MRELLKQALASTRCNSLVQDPLHAELLQALQTTKQYGKMASKEGVSLIPRSKQVGPRKLKCLCLELGEQCVPVFASKLESAAPKKATRACKHCGEQSCSRKQSLAAMRFLIGDQIAGAKEAKKQRLKDLQHKAGLGCAVSRQLLKAELHCPLSGKSLFGATHVDHLVPFSILVVDWSLANEVDICKQKFVGRGQTKVFADGQLNDSWRDYHAKKAVLQVVTAKANLCKGTKVLT